jgi:hypothetical protein
MLPDHTEEEDWEGIEQPAGSRSRAGGLLNHFPQAIERYMSRRWELNR